MFELTLVLTSISGYLFSYLADYCKNANVGS